MVQGGCSTQQRRDLGHVNLRMKLEESETADLVLSDPVLCFWYRRWRLR